MKRRELDRGRGRAVVPARAVVAADCPGCAAPCQADASTLPRPVRCERCGVVFVLRAPPDGGTSGSTSDDGPLPQLVPGALVAPTLRLIAPCGQRGFWTEWTAQQLVPDREVVFKVISPEAVAREPALATRAEREARSAAVLDSPHVVRLLDHGVLAGGVPYLVTEKLRGETLRARLAGAGAMSLSETSQLLRQLGEALDEAHRRGLMHGSVAADSIFLQGAPGRPWAAKWLDFGITWQIDRPGPHLSPERILDASVADPPAERWALAVVIYRALTNQAPFTGDNLTALLAAIVECKPPLPGALGDSSVLGEWLGRALHRDPAKRFGSARQMAESFAAVVKQLPDVDQARPASHLGGPTES